MSTKFLSTEWLDAASAKLAEDAAFQATLTNVDLGIQFVVTGDEEVRYHLDIADGSASVKAGDLEDADVTVTNDRDTAVAISKGDLNTQMAFMTGKVKVSGNMAKLMMHLNVVNAFQRAVSEMDVEY